MELNRAKTLQGFGSSGFRGERVVAMPCDLFSTLGLKGNYPKGPCTPIIRYLGFG